MSTYCSQNECLLCKTKQLNSVDSGQRGSQKKISYFIARMHMTYNEICCLHSTQPPLRSSRCAAPRDQSLILICAFGRKPWLDNNIHVFDKHFLSDGSLLRVHKFCYPLFPNKIINTWQWNILASWLGTGRNMVFSLWEGCIDATNRTCDIHFSICG